MAHQLNFAISVAHASTLASFLLLMVDLEVSQTETINLFRRILPCLKMLFIVKLNVRNKKLSLFSQHLERVKYT